VTIPNAQLSSKPTLDASQVVAVIPALLGCAACVLAHGIPPRSKPGSEDSLLSVINAFQSSERLHSAAGAVFSALILLLSTAVIGGPLAGVLDNRSRKVRSGSAGPPRKHLIALSGGVALALSFALWLMVSLLRASTSRD
jgi:hypothetical protein